MARHALRIILLLVITCALAPAQTKPATNDPNNRAEDRPAHPRAGEPGGPPPGPVNVTPRSRLGVNIGRLRDWTPSFMFIDVMKSARRFASPEKPWEGEV